jgi:hypothetical protein
MITGPQRRSDGGRSVLTWAPAARGSIIADPIILLLSIQPKLGLYHHLLLLLLHLRKPFTCDTLLRQLLIGF